VDGNLEVNGFVKARAFLQFSDLRLKTNIEDLTDAINIISGLQGKTYYWKNGSLPEGKGGQRVFGLIAQEVQRVVPELVVEDPETGLLAVSYSELVPILIEAFKQHMQEYAVDKKNIHSELEELKTKVSEIEKVNQQKYKPRTSMLNLWGGQQNPTNGQYPINGHQYPPNNSQQPSRYPPPEVARPFIQPVHPQAVQLQYLPSVYPPSLNPPAYQESSRTIPLQGEQVLEMTSHKIDVTSLWIYAMGISLIVVGIIVVVVGVAIFVDARRRSIEPGLWFIAEIVGSILFSLGLLITCWGLVRQRG